MNHKGGGAAKLNSLFMNEVKILPVEKTGHFHFSDCYFNFLFSVELPVVMDLVSQQLETGRRRRFGLVWGPFAVLHGQCGHDWPGCRAAAGGRPDQPPGAGGDGQACPGGRCRTLWRLQWQ